MANPKNQRNNCPFCGVLDGHSPQCNFAIKQTPEELEAKKKREFEAKKKFGNERVYRKVKDGE